MTMETVLLYSELQNKEKAVTWTGQLYLLFQ